MAHFIAKRIYGRYALGDGIGIPSSSDPKEQVTCTTGEMRHCYYTAKLPIGQIINGQFVSLIVKTYHR